MKHTAAVDATKKEDSNMMIIARQISVAPGSIST